MKPRQRASLPVLSLLLLAACGSVEQELPIESRMAALDAADRATPPPLYQLLYDSARLTEVQEVEQRTRLLIWLRYCALDPSQLHELRELHERAAKVARRVAAAEERIARETEPELVPIYEALFEGLAGGAPLDDPELVGRASPLLQQHLERDREREVLTLRLQAIRALLDEEQPFLQSLSPRQEVCFPDLLFALRHRIDQLANPGDFNALVGTIFSTGDPTLLLRGDFDLDRKPLDLGGLWSDESEEDLGAPILHEARRELLLYLLLQEPSLPDAIDGALRAWEKTHGTPDAGSAGGEAAPQ